MQAEADSRLSVGHSPGFVAAWRAVFCDVYRWRRDGRFAVVPQLFGAPVFAYLPGLDYADLNATEARVLAREMSGRSFNIRALAPEGEPLSGAPAGRSRTRPSTSSSSTATTSNTTSATAGTPSPPCSSSSTCSPSPCTPPATSPKPSGSRAPAAARHPLPPVRAPANPHRIPGVPLLERAHDPARHRRHRRAAALISARPAPDTTNENHHSNQNPRHQQSKNPK